ncbi:MAG TPA: DoxX family protein [Rhodopseudomonas sp.]|uniref:DoxX family protein n=1 Tax=Rhodopseudomonas sp. TaxID=1078 RepID=UPI002ED96627
MDSAARPGASPGAARAVMRWVMAVFFAAAGVLHLTAPDQLLAITPSFVPFAPQVIFVTGLCEIAGALALLTALRWWAGVAFALYALLVWPANIKHAFAGIELPGLPSSWWYHGPRLALQPVIIWWALYCAEVIDWPWRGRAAAQTPRDRPAGRATGR